MNQKTLMILGMHRTGTSALTRVLNLLGVFVGDKLLPPAEDNIAGFWEHADLYNVHERVLQTMHHNWSDILPFPEKWWLDEKVQPLRREIIGILERDFKDRELWGLKDPRLCRLLPLWHSILSELGCEKYFAVIFRNPLEVASSLAKRDGFTIYKSALLWFRHVSEAELYTRGYPRAFVEYSQLLEDWERVVENINRRTGLSLQKDIPSVRQGIADFLSPSLRHHSASYEEMVERHDVPSFVVNTYRELVKASLVDGHDLTKGLSSYRMEFEDRLAAFSPVIAALEEVSISNQERTAWGQLVSERDFAVRQRDGQIENLNQAVTEREGEIASLKQTMGKRDEQIANLSQVIAERDGRPAETYQSMSWRVTAPMRATKVMLRKVRGKVRDAMGRLSSLGFQFGIIKENEAVNTSAFIEKPLETLIKENKNKADSFIAYQEHKPLVNCRVKVVAFYLPQFHTIPENDRWWGEGFTEWSNVKLAQPQFEGHYQPHVPGELGYYDLLDINVQQRQVELARNYGIGGFCFYFYWFAGKTLLEKPIENYLQNTQLDLPFCLAWANENWTRRWDGRENEILIGQQHSPKDDIGFIMHVSKYMQDKRYIRINGKPLLIIYRPGLFQSAKDTALRWRRWCNENNIGEIYLAYAQSFDRMDPEEIGYDSAIEFPPLNWFHKKLTHSQNSINKNFKCNVSNWETVMTNVCNLKQPAYKLFRGVCPSWDNTPRRKNESYIFYNSDPEKFRQWVTIAAEHTIESFDNSDERIVFVNAWNEWGEGAYLEPDEKYGYSYLESVYNALKKLKI